MKKIIVTLTSVVVFAGLTFLTGAYYVGYSIEQNFISFREELTNSGQFQVHKFDYEYSVFSGQLDYDIEWLPTENSSLRTQYDLIATENPEFFRINGDLIVNHGPWVGGPTPFALARLETDIPFPEDAITTMPQLAVDDVIINLNSTLSFSQSLSVQLTSFSYDGSVIENNEEFDLKFTGINSDFTIDQDLLDYEINFGIDQFDLASESFRTSLHGISLLVDGSRATSSADLVFSSDLLSGMIEGVEDFEYIMAGMASYASLEISDSGFWLGENRGEIQRIAFNSPEINFELLEIKGTGETLRTESELVDSIGSLSIADIKVNDNSIATLGMNTGFRNLDTYAIQELEQLNLELSSSDTLNDSQVMRAQEVFNRILATSPSFSIDQLQINLPDQDSITGSLSIGYNSPEVLPADFEQHLLFTYFQSELDIPITAARGIAEYAIEISGVAPGSDAEFDVEFENLLESIEEAGFVIVTENSVSSDLEIADSRVVVNGVTIMSLDDLLDQLNANATAVPLPPIEADNTTFQTDAAFANVALETGFTPDPYTVSVQAGGGYPASAVLGVECLGNVTSDQPHVAIQYQSGDTYNLYVFAQSDIDTTLLVLGPEGWYCDDDSHGNYNPGVQISEPATGSYLIWVGTYENGTTDAVLGISEY